MRVTVLGASGSYPGPDAACSGFVVEHDGSRILVDLGWGTLPRLLALLGNHVGDGLDGVVVTHDHPDHMADLHGLFRARWFGRRGSAPLPLVAPRAVMARLVAAEDGDEQVVGRVFAWQDAMSPVDDIGPFGIVTIELPHYVPTVGVRLTAGDLAVAFTGDTGPSDRLAELGRGVDLFVADATDRHQQPGVAPVPAGQADLNLTAAEAGLAATGAGARALMLTHLWPGNDPARSRRDAESTYAGPVLVARDHLVVDVPVAGS